MGSGTSGTLASWARLGLLRRTARAGLAAWKFRAGARGESCRIVAISGSDCRGVVTSSATSLSVAEASEQKSAREFSKSQMKMEFPVLEHQLRDRLEAWIGDRIRDPDDCYEPARGRLSQRSSERGTVGVHPLQCRVPAEPDLRDERDLPTRGGVADGVPGVALRLARFGECTKAMASEVA